MNAAALILAVVTGVLLFRLPRQWAMFPFLLGSLYMTYGQQVEIGPFNFSVMRMLIVVGFVRTMVRGERIAGGVNKLDRMAIAWAVCAVCSSVFHTPFSGALVSRLGMIFNGLGAYWLMRVFIRDMDDVLRVSKMLIVILIPIALEMAQEKFSRTNWFGEMFGARYGVEIRNGKARAQGPFGHSILAGTAGAVCFPLALLFWRKNRKFAIMGLAVTLGMVVASASSGPIMTTAICVGALFLWRMRHMMRSIRIGSFIGLFLVSLMMNDPVYYLLARIDLTGSSTGWHRAALIESSIKHLSEWWFAGTDYTAHWMPTGIQANTQHTDITNYYIGMGVAGGLPLMFLFMGEILMGFSLIGKGLKALAGSEESQYVTWVLGAILFGHAMTFLTVPYFDQTTVPFYFLLAAIGSIPAWKAAMQFSPATAPTSADSEWVAQPRERTTDMNPA